MDTDTDMDTDTETDTDKENDTDIEKEKEKGTVRRRIRILKEKGEPITGKSLLRIIIKKAPFIRHLIYVVCNGIQL